MSAEIDRARCAGCGACRLICPPRAVVRQGLVYTVVSERCVRCRKCIGVCPVGCITLTDGTPTGDTSPETDR